MPEVFDRFLLQLDMTRDIFLVTENVLEGAVDNNDTIGDFLADINGITVDGIQKSRTLHALPQILFVVSSGPEVVGACNYLRNARNFMLRAQQLLSYSPRSRAGKWWEEKSKNPQHNLAYIISLFTARLTTLAPSAVVYACLFHSDDLQALATDAEIQPHQTNAMTTLESTDFYKFLAGKPPKETTSSRKGRVAPKTLKAYADI